MTIDPPLTIGINQMQIAPSAPTRKPEKLLRLSDVESLTGLKKSSIYAGMKASPPTFPRPTPVREGCLRLIGWPLASV
jgi:predicted DNA-binding transcriptional regulator AlpA